jgi:predicted RNase H-like nuclease (RuvC/YqgF family)
MRIISALLLLGVSAIFTQQRGLASDQQGLATRLAALEVRVEPAMRLADLSGDLREAEARLSGLEKQLESFERPGPRYTAQDGRELEARLRRELDQVAARVERLRAELLELRLEVRGR